MKRLFKKIVAVILWRQVKRLKKKNNFIVIAVAGSIGKTSTKLAIGKTLAAGKKVQYQEGNYNDLVSVPLIFFGRNMPSLFNPLAWLKIFLANEKTIKKQYPFDVVVVEVGTDRPGDLAGFKPYLKADYGVLTAITPEHMQAFGQLEAVAKEELIIADLCQKLFYNLDYCEEKYLTSVPNKISYGFSPTADYSVQNYKFTPTADFEIFKNGNKISGAKNQFISEAQLYSAAAAAALADEMKLPAEKISTGLSQLTPAAGRMQLLQGVAGSVIIDDTYNASPAAVIGALDVVYRFDSPHKIAILGNMNEMGSLSQEVHEEVGAHCNPKQLALVATLGPDANKYLAPAAEKAGCKVITFNDPYTLGEYVKPILKKDTLVLVKGSQNKVFAEEAVKILLANPADSSKLVRQSADWSKAKKKMF